MARFTLLLSSICSIFVLSWFLTRWFGPANCINSTLVGKVVTDGTQSDLKICDISVRLTHSQPEGYIVETRLIRRIESLEVVSPYLDYQDMPVIVSIITKKNQILSFQNNVIHISKDFLEKDGLLEKSILFLKLNNSSPLSASAVADFLYSELIRAESEDLTPRPWLEQLTTLHAYCLSENLLLIHYDFCKAHNELSDSYISDSEAVPVPWSLTPIYTQVLRNLYRQASLNEKKSMLENILFLGELEDSFIEEHTQKANALNQEYSFAEMVKDWLMPLMLPKQRVFDAIAQFSLSNLSQINYVVVGRTSRDVFALDFALNATSKDHKESLVIEFGQTKYFYPSDVALNFSQDQFFKKYKVNNLIYVSCEMPEVESLLQFENQATRVLFIRQCEYDDIDWAAISRDGVSTYLSSNKSVEFIEFNLSAIKLAKRVRGPLRNTDDFGAWQKWLLWQSVIKDDGLDIRRPISAIDGVRRYRMF